MSNRVEKVNSLLLHEVGMILQKDFNFPGGLVTLTRVDTTPNLIEARCYISVMPEDNADSIIKTLNKAVFDVQQNINRMVNMRPVPKIIFVKDTQVAAAAKVESILGQLKNEQK